MPSLQLPQLFIDLQIPLLYLNNILALAIGPQRRGLQLLLSFPTVVLLVAQSLYREWTGAWGIHYALNTIMLAVALTWVDWIALGNPDAQAWGKMKYSVENGLVLTKKEASPPKEFLGRLWWAVRLATTNRYVGWSSQVKGVRLEVGPDYPRWLFVLRKALRAVLFYLAKDFFAAYTAGSPHGSWLDIEHIKSPVTFDGYSFWHCFMFTWIYICISYVNLEMVNCIYGVVSVATGLANPRDCPSQFGDLKELYSVRKAWSSVWHQGFRRVFSSPAIYLARDVLRLRKGSFASKYVQLFVTFGFSGLAHAGGSMLCHRSLEDDKAMAAFLLQAVIIMVEDHVIDFGKRLGFKDSRFWRLVGFVWTVLAVGISIQAWLDATLRQGMWVQAREKDWFGVGPA